MVCHIDNGGQSSEVESVCCVSSSCSSSIVFVNRTAEECGIYDPRKVMIPAGMIAVLVNNTRPWDKCERLPIHMGTTTRGQQVQGVACYVGMKCESAYIPNKIKC